MILIFLFCLFAGGLYAQSSQPPNILFIFDASGSMWGKLGNRTKIQVAKETMIKLVQKTGEQSKFCLLYTSDAADERSSVDLGGRRIIKKKIQHK